jgi:hypothetical protein
MRFVPGVPNYQLCRCVRFLTRHVAARCELFAAICFFFSPARHLSRLSGIALSPHRSNKSARIFATRGDVGDLYEGSASAPSGAPAIVVF